MTQQRLEELIARGENADLEFKRSLTKDVGPALCAFANSGGGTLLIGVSDGGDIVGVANHNRVKGRVQSTARSVDPAIDIEIRAVGEVLCVTVPPQRGGAHSFGGRFFRRAGATTQQMISAEIERLYYATGRLHFDKTPCPDFDIARLIDDDDAWARFSERAKIPAGMDRVVALRNLGLIDGRDRVTHAAALLVARDIRTVTASAHVSCALFLGRTKSRILDRRDFHDNAAALVDDVTAWILTKINVEFIIKTVRRTERPELPEDALREAVANAVAHRDYRSTANVQVYVFKDRVEVVSPGSLPLGMTKRDLGTKSVARNPLLFGMLYRMDVVEQIGSGVRRMFDLCRDHGVADPVIAVSEHWVTVTFRRPPQDPGEPCGPESGAELTAGGPGSEQGRGQRPESGPDYVDRQSMEEVDDPLDRRVLRLLVPGPLSKSAIARGLGHRSVSGGLNRVIRRLRQDGHVNYTRPDKPNSSRQQYRVTRSGLLAVREGR